MIGQNAKNGAKGRPRQIIRCEIVNATPKTARAPARCLGWVNPVKSGTTKVAAVHQPGPPPVQRHSGQALQKKVNTRPAPASKTGTILPALILLACSCSQAGGHVSIAEASAASGHRFIVGRLEGWAGISPAGHVLPVTLNWWRGGTREASCLV